jgi:hypothetical protein
MVGIGAYIVVIGMTVEAGEYVVTTGLAGVVTRSTDWVWTGEEVTAGWGTL